MINSIIFIFLVASHTANPGKNLLDDPWCQMMDQERSSTAGNPNYTDWVLKERYPSGQVKTETKLSNQGSGRDTYGEDGRLVGREYTRVHYWDSSFEIESMVERYIYNTNGNLSRIEGRDLSGSLAFQQDYEYDSENRWIEFRKSYSKNGIKRLRVTSFTWDSTGHAVTNHDDRLDESGPIIGPGSTMDISRFDAVGRPVRYQYYDSFQEGSFKPTVLIELEYDDSGNAEYYKKRTETRLYISGAPKTVQFYDKADRPLATYLQNPSGDLQLSERFSYTDKIDVNFRPIHSEAVKYAMGAGGEIIESKTVTDYLYGSKGIVQINATTTDDAGVFKSNRKKVFGYCTDE